MAVNETLRVFMCNKLVDFVSTYINNRISDKKNKVSALQFEREFRQQLFEISDKIENLEAVVYQEVKLFDKVMSQLEASSVLEKNNDFMIGNVYIIVGFDSEALDLKKIREMVSKEVDAILAVQEINNTESEKQIDTSPQKVNAFIAKTLAKADDRLKELRKDE